MSGWQCGRCGTIYGLLTMVVRGDYTRHKAHKRRFARCRTKACPTTPRALLWRLFGKRAGGCTGGDWRPGFLYGLRSLRHGDLLMMSDDP